MSRVGKRPVSIPAGLDVTLSGSVLRFAKGGIEEFYNVDARVVVELGSNCIVVKPVDSVKGASAIWGTTQKNISNIIQGLTVGFSTDLELVGVGYKASVVGKQLVLELGYSHDIRYDIPADISIICSKPTCITVSGYSKKRVGDVVALIKKYRQVEPYKGKGVIKSGDFVYRKEGKKK